MKKLFTLIAALTILITAAASQAQVKVLLSDVANIELPSGAQKITSAQAIPFVISKLKSDKVDLEDLKKFKKDNLYVIGNVLADFHTGNKPAKPNHLESLKRGFEEMHRGDVSYHSNIQTDDKKSIWIEESATNTIQSYQFISFNIQNTKSAAGIVECNVTDAAEGKRVFDQIVKSLKFE